LGWREKGTSIVEYGLMGLLCTFCGVGLFTLGIHIQHLLEGSSRQAASANNTFVSQILGSPVSAATMKNPNASTANGNNAALPLSTLISLPSYNNAQTAPQTPLQLSGANGMTEQLASTLTANASNMLAAGEITQAQANLLIALADQGHILAQNQSLFENALKSGQKSIAYKGKTYSLADFANQLAFNANTSSTQNWQLNPTQTSPLLQPFAQIYQEVQQSGMLNNPQVQQQVSSVAIQIGALSDALGWSADDVLGKNSTVSPADAYTIYQSALATHFQTDMEGAPINGNQDSNVQSASVATTTHSITICNAGSGQDNGSTCTP